MGTSTRIPARIQWAADQLLIRPKEQVLEIGCAGGHLLALLAERAPSARLTGIDRSKPRVERTQAAFQATPWGRRIRIAHQTLVEAAAARPLSVYSVVVAVNVNTFWVAPEQALPALRRLMAPRGRAYLVFEPPSAMAARRVETELSHLLIDHGFKSPIVRVAAAARSTCLCFETSVRRRSRTP